MLAPESVKVPLPVLVSAPPVPLITPAKAVLLPSPVVKVLLPKVTVVPATPVNDPIVSPLFSVRSAPEVLRFTTPVLASAEPPVSTSVPALTVVRPV